MHPTPPSIPSFRGVYEADPENPPAPPPGAKAVEIKDRTGRVISYGWVVPEHADAWFTTIAWDYLDFRDSFNQPFAPALKLVEPPDEIPGVLPIGPVAAVADQARADRPPLALHAGAPARSGASRA